ncbi:hypothetical protein A5662_21410 [Mycobacteriaceae bacterium 1482268.1]|nr:hypothetical protein A5662_21410 [Mycobacteriaceae bacterium 1482268.1]
MVEAEHVVLSTRIAALILLLYGTSVSKICNLSLDDITTTPARRQSRSATHPHPYPKPYSPSSTNTSPGGETTAP